MFGIDCRIPGLDCLIPGMDCLMSGIDCLISDIGCLISGLDNQDAIDKIYSQSGTCLCRNVDPKP